MLYGTISIIIALALAYWAGRLHERQHRAKRAAEREMLRNRRKGSTKRHMAFIADGNGTTYEYGDALAIARAETEEG